MFLVRSMNEKRLCYAQQLDSEQLCALTDDEADQSRQKKARRDKFDLLDAVHRAEYSSVKRPVGKRSGEPIEPAHKLEINLEPDSLTKEK